MSASASAEVSWVVGEIAGMGGVVSGERFMQLALYHQEHGYYQKIGEIFGRGGDYVTAPVMTSLFGELVCLQLIEVWEIMGVPERFVVIEAGSGTGHLAVDILRTAGKFPQFNLSLDYRCVEISKVLQNMQRQRLADAGLVGRCSWFGTLADAGGEGIEGVIFGNEFLDALPVRWLEMTAGGLCEVGVKATVSGELTTVAIPLGEGLAVDYFTRMGVNLPIGMRTEVGVIAQEWMRKAGQVVRRGVVLLIDYGYSARDYYHPDRRQGTLVGHYQHRRIDDPLVHPGAMDLTAHVDFSAMARAGRQGGLEVCGYTTQGWFFMGLGLLERLQGVAQNRGGKGLGREIRETALRLVLPEAMGERFKVLAMSKGMDPPGLSGYRLNNQRNEL